MNRAVYLTMAWFLLLLLASYPAPASSNKKEIREVSLVSNSDRAGKVYVMNDDWYLHIKFEVSKRWSWLADTHVDVETDPEGIPQICGKAQPCLFFHERRHHFPERKHILKIPMRLSWRSGEFIYIAAAAQITGFSGRYQMYWADGDAINIEEPGPPEDGMFLKYTVQ
jgi:hypothetical protein